jgi:hypothetical protein
MRYAARYAAGGGRSDAAQQTPRSAIPPLSWLARIGVKPYPPSQGGADGLSLHVDDCNEVCIDIPIR